MKFKFNHPTTITAITAAVIVWVIPLSISSVINDSSNQSASNQHSNQSSNKQTITFDKKEIIAYTQFTDKVELTKSDTALEGKQVDDELAKLEAVKLAEDRKVLEDKRIAEVNRKAEIERKIAADKLAEELRIAEEKRQVELAEAAEVKRLAELEAKRVAKNKADEEAKKVAAKKNETEKVVVSRGNTSNSTEAYYEITAYTAGVESTGKSKGDKNYGLTASGNMVQNNVTLACPRSIPFGTKIDIEGYGVRVCHDRGAHIVNNRLDIYMESLDSALSFGRRTIKVRILN